MRDSCCICELSVVCILHGKFRYRAFDVYTLGLMHDVFIPGGLTRDVDVAGVL